jgi:preprotein translocase subunit SecG
LTGLVNGSSGPEFDSKYVFLLSFQEEKFFDKMTAGLIGSFYIRLIVLSFQEDKKKFDKMTAKFCQSLERHLNMKTNKASDVTLKEVSDIFLILFIYF